MRNRAQSVLYGETMVGTRKASLTEVMHTTYGIPKGKIVCSRIHIKFLMKINKFSMQFSADTKGTK